MRMILNNNASNPIHPPISMGELHPGEVATIIGFCVDSDLQDSQQDFLQRLFEVGFLVGEKIEVLHEAPLSHDPISIQVKDAVYAIRRKEANLIQVRRS